jgi:NADH-quinone oxidoreductase subunit D
MEPLERTLDDIEAAEPQRETMLVNIGPSHPCTHGTVRIVVEIDGESIQRADVQVGFLHRGFEKMAERGTWAQVFPYVDRCNYVSPLLNNFGYALACEKLLGIQVPERCVYYRMVLSELARMVDHLTCTGAMVMELAAFTPFLWMMKGRDMVYDIFEEETGARVTHSFGRIGGVAKPPSRGFKENVAAVVVKLLEIVDEVKRLLYGTRVFLDRVENVGVMAAEDAISLGWTGPTLRACGVPYDVRRAHPYLAYDQVEFDVPVGQAGDCYDRFAVRLEEVIQSARIIEQCLERLPDEGPVCVDDPRVVLPPKDKVYTTIEATIQHFKLIMEGLKMPAGEVYSYTEAGNGELGFYIVSDGSGTPYRVRIRPPCFLITGGLEHLITGAMVPDIVPCFGSLNMIGGECDR